jgi:hypothetical protein
VNPIQRFLARRTLAVLTLLALAALAGCASTQVSNRQKYAGERLPRPQRILVYDFGSSPDQIPPESGLAGQVEAPSKPPTADELEVAQKLGVEVAKKLAEEISDMDLPGMRAVDRPPPRPNDIMIRGFFLSVDEGSMLKRLAIGFGSGTAELKTYVEGYQMTESGPRLLGSGDINSGTSGGTPGVAVPIVVTVITLNPIGLVVGGVVKGVGELSGMGKIQATAEETAEKIAEELRPQFERQGWIED